MNTFSATQIFDAQPLSAAEIERAMVDFNDVDLSDWESSSPVVEPIGHSVPATVSRHACPQCGKSFLQRRNMFRHIRAAHEKVTFPCGKCEKVFTRRDILVNHMRSHEEPSTKRVRVEVAGPSTVSRVDPHEDLAVAGPSRVDPQEELVVEGPPKKIVKPRARECNICGKLFASSWHVKRHLKTHDKKPVSRTGEYECGECGEVFTTAFNLNRHAKIHSGERDHVCSLCRRRFTQKSHLMQHSRVCREGEHPEARAPRRRVGGGGGRVLNTFSTQTLYPTEEEAGDFAVFQGSVRRHIQSHVSAHLNAVGPVKWYVGAQMQFSRVGGDGEVVNATPHFWSRVALELTEEHLEEHAAEAISQIEGKMDKYTNMGSGWILDHIIHAELKLSAYHPLAASSYLPLPPVLSSKKAILNIQNDDQRCFLWSVLAHLYPASDAKQAYRVSNYMPHVSKLNLDGIEFPMTLPRIGKFEELNDLSINVYGYDKEVFPLRVTSARTDNHISLLLIADGDNRHYCLINSMGRLLSDRTKHDGKRHYCDYCLHRFVNKQKMEEHRQDCEIHGVQKIKYPTEGNKWLEFVNHEFQLPVPFVIYADFESVLMKPVEEVEDGANTKVLNTHIPCGYCYIIVNSKGELYKPPSVFRGEGAVDHFLKSVMEDADDIKAILKAKKPMSITRQQMEVFQKATTCHICQKTLGEARVRDHCHITGEYRGPAHNACNLRYQLSRKIPVMLHNLKNYDSHLIIQGLGKMQGRELECIPSNMERFISFSIDHLKFLDTLQFMPSSLESLVSDLPRSDFHLLSKEYPSEKLDLLLRKGVYPYEYMDGFDKFEEESLPPRSMFYSTLTDEEVSEDAYTHAQEVWDRFEIKNIGEYHDLYVKSDVMQLADVFQNFRKLCLSYYQIDPCHVYTAPGLAWQACLKMTGIRLELLTDPAMHLFVERGIRGGISMISNRYSEANNKYLEGYDPTKPSKYIGYYDANNLYGWAMSEALPFQNFSWVEDIGSLTTDQILSLSDDGKQGYIFEVDLDYPINIHDHHNDYPLAPEKMVVTTDMISSYSTQAAEEMGVRIKECMKLVPNLLHKKHYVVHYRNLKQYLGLGMTLKTIHRCLRFDQSPWLAKYIAFNTAKRRDAKNIFEKNIFKLLNNSVFGKTMENLRNRVDVRLVNDEKTAKKLVASPAFRRFTTIEGELVAIQRLKTSLLLNRPIYVGFSILDISKILMYDFHYTYMRAKYGVKAKLLFTDTDSLCYEVETNDLYADMHENSHLFDMSDYPPEHPLYSTSNKKVLGKFKDEMAGIAPSTFVGLRSKMYSILTKDHEKNVAKGVNRAVIRKKLKHKQYVECLLQNTRTYETMTNIRSHNHKVTTSETKKIALCPLDTKRYILLNGCDTRAIGHYVNNTL